MILKPTFGDTDKVAGGNSSEKMESWAAVDPTKANPGKRKTVGSSASSFGKVIDDRKKSIGRDSGIRQCKGGRPLEHETDPAIMAMRAAGLQTTGKDLVPVKEYAKNESGLEERPSEVAKKTFEEHGLDFIYVATKVHEIMDGGDPNTQLRTLEMVNKILLKSEEENEEMKKLLEAARTPSVVINIASPFSSQEKSHLDILIPS